MANVTLEEIKARLAAIEIYIPGVVTAHKDAPRTINRTDMPAFVNFAGDSNNDLATLGSDAYLQTRNMRLMLLIDSAASGVSGEVEEKSAPLIDAVTEFFMARPGLSVLPLYPSLSGVMNSFITGDSGLSVITYQEQQYLGIEFRLTMILMKRRYYAEGECPPPAL